MNARDAISEITRTLPDARVKQLLDYARYLCLEVERADWKEFGKVHLAKAYGDDEPEYSEADLRRDSRS